MGQWKEEDCYLHNIKECLIPVIPRKPYHRPGNKHFLCHGQYHSNTMHCQPKDLSLLPLLKKAESILTTAKKLMVHITEKYIKRSMQQMSRCNVKIMVSSIRSDDWFCNLPLDPVPRGFHLRWTCFQQDSKVFPSVGIPNAGCLGSQLRCTECGMGSMELDLPLSNNKS